VPTVLFRNGTFWSGRAGAPTFDGMLVEDGKIAAIGDTALSSVPDEVVDLAGRFVMPSFADGHAHPLFGGREAFGPQVTGLHTIEAVVAAVAAFAGAHPDADWIVGGAYDPALEEHGLMDALWLDEAVSDRPVVLHAMDHHTVWVNSAALRIAGIDADTPSLEIGTVVRRDDGSPLGTLREWDAVDLVLRHAPAAALEAEIESLRYSCARMAESGVTWWQDAWVDRGMAEIYLAAQERGVLSVGVNLGFRADPRTWQQDLPYFVEQRSAIERSPGNYNLTARTVKFFSDGVIEGGTAALLEPYLDDPCSHGMPVWSAAALADAVVACDAAGFQVHIHAIGDAGIRQALDAIERAIEENPKWDRRPVIAHVQLLDAADLPRFHEMGVLANFCPLWTQLDPMQAILSAPRIGEERTGRQYRMRSLIDDGVTLTFGSDWPVTSEVPLAGLAVAVHRQTPDRFPPGGWIAHESISMGEALQAYSVNVARQAFADHEWGTLALGMRANFIVLAGNPLEMDAHDVARMTVDRTYRNGVALHCVS
jgi:predicted amidohydrolase YtcJ